MASGARVAEHEANMQVGEGEAGLWEEEAGGEWLEGLLA
jgi:hypothetical protein